MKLENLSFLKNFTVIFFFVILIIVKCFKEELSMKINKNIFKYIFFTFLMMFSFKSLVFADELSCSDLGEIRTDLNNVFNFIKIVVPLLIIGLSTYDFIKGIAAKDEKGLKKAFSTLIKRIICAIIIFFLPAIINILLDLIGIGGETCID